MTQRNQPYRSRPLATACAKSFVNLARPFLDEVAAGDLNAGVQKVAANTSNLVSAATNLLLAIELYLKSLLIGSNLNPPRRHDLGELFKYLPSDRRNAIEARYSRARASREPTQIKIIHAAMQAWPDGGKPIAPRPEDFPPVTGPDTVAGILERAGDSFCAWRYIYESVRQGERYFFITLEYGRLLLLCEVIDQYIRDSDS
jgi:hypothetical protein